MKEIRLLYEATARMCADIFTKAFSSAAAWRHACDLIQIVDPKVVSELVKSPDIGPEPPIAVSLERGGGGVPNSAVSDLEAPFTIHICYREDGSQAQHLFYERIRHIGLDLHIAPGCKAIFGLCNQNKNNTIVDDTLSNLRAVMDLNDRANDVVMESKGLTHAMDGNPLYHI
ncbi:MAG: hypothetical protein ACKPKO_40105, partial [Candidatus Fonsibacter sp.]